MSNNDIDNNPHIRRLKPDDIQKSRQWPAKKHLASEQPTPVPQASRKNRIHSVLTALPVLMLMIGLYVYYSGEQAERDGSPVLSELTTVTAEYTRMTGLSGRPTAQRFLWYLYDGRERSVRITPAQVESLQVLVEGDAIELTSAPHIAESRTRWAHAVSRDGVMVLTAP